MAEQYVILVDEENNEIGTEEKIKAHKEGKLHRAFSIFIFNSKGELLLQQRQKSKYHSGGLWSNTVCSHPRPGETYEVATKRRLMEEMGFECEMKKLFCFIYNTGFQNGLIENEYDCVFAGKFDGTPEMNEEEVMDFKWMDVGELREDIEKNPDNYSVWLRIALKKMKDSDIGDVAKGKF